VSYSTARPQNPLRRDLFLARGAAPAHSAAMSHERGRERLKADLAASVAALFRRCPPLCGFSLDGELCVAQVACHPALGSHGAAVIADEIVRALSELVDAEPEAVELIRGRTFARALH
jgi:hypothetical protein